MNAAVSDQMTELDGELQGLLGKFKALIENRSAWADGVEGCREGVVTVGNVRRRLQSILESARAVETDLASARAELERWSKMHADLSTVERDLRAELDRYRKMHSDLAAVEHELLAAREKQQATIAAQASSLANARALAQEMIREIGN